MGGEKEGKIIIQKRVSRKEGDRRTSEENGEKKRLEKKSCLADAQIDNGSTSPTQGPDAGTERNEAKKKRRDEAATTSEAKASHRHYAATVCMNERKPET